MPNLLVKNRIKEKVVHVFDSVFGNSVMEARGAIRSVVRASYSRTLLIAIFVGLLRNTMVCLQKIVTSN